MSNTVLTNVSIGIGSVGIGIGDGVSTSTTHLPTAKEYREAADKAAFQLTAQWSEPKYQCPECGGGMCKNQMITLTSHPAQYIYQCNKCGYKEYQHM